MRIILDTHIFLWAISEPHKISKARRQQIERRTNQVYISAITITELMIKSSIGKLTVNFDPIQISKDSGFELLDYSATDALGLNEMPFHHKDPFDRMLISQAINQDYHLMSDDTKLSLYDCKLI